MTIKQPEVVFGHRLSLAGVGGRNGAHQPIGSSEMINVESSEKDWVTHRGWLGMFPGVGGRAFEAEGTERTKAQGPGAARS